MDYAQLLTRALRIAWRHKSLWVFGWLATAGSWLPGLSGRLLFRPEWLQAFEADPTFLLALLENGTILTWATIFLLIFFVVGLALWLLSAIAEAGLIWAAAQMEHGPGPTLGEVWRHGVGFLGRLIIVDTLIFLPLFLVVMVALLLGSGGLIGLVLAADSGAAPSALVTYFSLGALVVVCLMSLAIPVLILTLLFRQLAFRGVVLSHLRPMPGIRQAGFLLRQHLLSIIIVLLFVWSLSAMVKTAFFVPNFFLPLGAMMVAQSQAGWGWLFDAGGLLLEGAKAAVVAALFVFTAILWTLAYQEFTRPGVEP
jgi:hypothetical protein